MSRAWSAVFALMCVLALSLAGCVTGPGFGKAERDQPPKEIKRQPPTEEMRHPAATEQPKHPAATETKPAKKSPPAEDSNPPPAPKKPPAIGGSGG